MATKLQWKAFALHSKLFSYLWKCPINYDIKKERVFYTSNIKTLVPWYFVNIVVLFIGINLSSLYLLLSENFNPNPSVSMIHILFNTFLNQGAIFASSVSYLFLIYGDGIAQGLTTLHRLLQRVSKSKFQQINEK